MAQSVSSIFHFSCPLRNYYSEWLLVLLPCFKYNNGTVFLYKDFLLSIPVFTAVGADPLIMAAPCFANLCFEKCQTPRLILAVAFNRVLRGELHCDLFKANLRTPAVKRRLV